MLKIFPNLEKLNHFAAEKFIETGGEAIKARGRFTVALSGGSTPKMLYKLLVSDDFRSQIDWEKVFFFFGDERNVPPDSGESNFRTARENLFRHLSLPAENIFRWQTEKFANAAEIAANYEETIDGFFDKTPQNMKAFDLIFLGMGDDAHTASLFPETKALTETEKSAVANFVEKFDSYRLTLTFPVINNSKNIIFLVSGENKAGALKEVLDGEFQPDKFPSQNVKPENGNLLWLVDEAAAKLLDS